MKLQVCAPMWHSGHVYIIMWYKITAYRLSNRKWMETHGQTWPGSLFTDAPGYLRGCTGTREVHPSHNTPACCFPPPWMCQLPLCVSCLVDHKSALQASTGHRSWGQWKMHVKCSRSFFGIVVVVFLFFFVMWVSKQLDNVETYLSSH